MKVAGPKFPPIGEFIRMLSIDVYGRPDDGLIEGLRQKAEMLGSGTVRVYDLHAGFAAFPRDPVQSRAQDAPVVAQGVVAELRPQCDLCAGEPISVSAVDLAGGTSSSL
jgi:hypothetical protein